MTVIRWPELKLADPRVGHAEGHADVAERSMTSKTGCPAGNAFAAFHVLAGNHGLGRSAAESGSAPNRPRPVARRPSPRRPLARAASNSASAESRLASTSSIGLLGHRTAFPRSAFIRSKFARTRGHRGLGRPLAWPAPGPAGRGPRTSAACNRSRPSVPAADPLATSRRPLHERRAACRPGLALATRRPPCPAP